MKLTLRQEIFCREYVVDFNGSRAAVAAGYSKKTADQQASRLLKNSGVQGAIKKEIEKRSKRIEITQDRVLEEIARVAFADLSDFLDVDEATGAVRVKGFDEMPVLASRVLESISEDRVIREAADGKQVIIHDKRKIKLHDKMRALEMCGTPFGLVHGKA